MAKARYSEEYISSLANDPGVSKKSLDNDYLWRLVRTKREGLSRSQGRGHAKKRQGEKSQTQVKKGKAVKGSNSYYVNAYTKYANKYGISKSAARRSADFKITYNELKKQLKRLGRAENKGDEATVKEMRRPGGILAQLTEALGMREPNADYAFGESPV